MKYVPFVVRRLMTWVPAGVAVLAAGGFVLAACGDEGSGPGDPPPATMMDASRPGAPPPSPAQADAGYSCTPASGCTDVDIGEMTTKACCSPVLTCGFELPPIDDETLMLFPQVVPFYEMLTKGDPRGRCAPQDFFFGPRPGLWPHRVETEDGKDILITPDCESYTLAAFILPGCCLPDDTCGLSTDESWPVFEGLTPDSDAPFRSPECVPAEVLNQQFRDSVTLEDFARTVASGTCNHAALAAELPDEDDGSDAGAP